MAKMGNDMRRLNIGGGARKHRHRMSGWDVLDKSGTKYNYPPKWLTYDIDLETLEPWAIPDNIYDVVYSGHTIEHIPNSSLPHVLSECHRVLKAGGLIRIQVPDAVHFWESARGGRKEELWKLLDMVATSLTNNNLVDWGQAAVDLDRMTYNQFCEHYCCLACDVENPSAGGHRNWFDYDKLDRAIAEAGFVSLRRAKPHDSECPEMRTHKFDRLIPDQSIYIEARKPMPV